MTCLIKHQTPIPDSKVELSLNIFKLNAACFKLNKKLIFTFRIY